MPQRHHETEDFFNVASQRPDLALFALHLTYRSSEDPYAFAAHQLTRLLNADAVLILLPDTHKQLLKVKASGFSEQLPSKAGENLTRIVHKIPLSALSFRSSPGFRFSDAGNMDFGEGMFKVTRKLQGILGESSRMLELSLTLDKAADGIVWIISSSGPLNAGEKEAGFLREILSRSFSEKRASDEPPGNENSTWALFQESPAISCLLDPKGRITSVNKAWVETFGSMISMNDNLLLENMVAGSHKAELAGKLSHLPENRSFSCNPEIRGMDGQERYFELQGRIIDNTDTAHYQVLCVLHDVTATKKSEIQARLQEEKVEAIANYTSNWESWFDTNGRLIWTNPASFRFTGYTPAEILNIPDYIETLVAAPDRERVAAVMAGAIQGTDEQLVEFRCIRKDQTEFMLSVSWKHIFDKEGKALGIRTSGQDITSYHKARSESSYAVNLYRQMIDNAPFGMHFYFIDEKGELVFNSFNHAADAILGIDHNPLLGLTILEAFPALAGTEVPDHYLAAARNNITWVSDQILYTDKKISGAFEVKAFQTAPGRMVSIFNDVTNRKKAEEALYESQQLFEALTTVSPVGIFRTDTEGHTTYVNPKWSDLTGLTFEEALGNKYLEAIHPDDREERIREWQEAVKYNTPVISEYRICRKDQSVIWVQGHAVPEKVNDRLKGYIGTITDITELKLFEKELLIAKEKAEASNRLKTSFMGNISHEIRTPLNGIIGFAELITSGNNTPEENLECAGFLNHSINRLTSIIDNMMDLSMMMSGNALVTADKFRIDLLFSEIIRRISRQAENKKLKLEISGLDELKGRTIIADRQLIRRIFGELCDNAIKFTNNGYIRIVTGLYDSTLTFIVNDSGIGISDQILPFIFEPFVQEDVYTTRMHNSSGLGLAIVREAISLLGGRISAESVPGSGTAITVSLPVVMSEVEEDEKPVADEPKNKIAGKTVMIVEDEEINMIYLKRILKIRNFKLLLAGNGPEAIGFINKGHPIDLILMDMKMPGMDGFETTRQIKALNPTVKIVAVTAYASDADRNACLNAGCDEYIAKPFQKNDLFALIDEIL